MRIATISYHQKFGQHFEDKKKKLLQYNLRYIIFLKNIWKA